MSYLHPTIFEAPEEREETEDEKEAEVDVDDSECEEPQLKEVPEGPLEKRPFMRIRPYRLAMESPLFNRHLVAINRLRTYIQNQRYLPHDLSQQFLSNMIKGSRSDTSEAKKNVKNFFYTRQNEPDLFGDRDPLGQLAAVFLSLYFLPGQTVIQDGPAVLFAGLTNPDPRVWNMKTCARMFFLTLDLIMNASSWEDGKFVILMDCRNLALSHFQSFCETDLRRRILMHLKDSFFIDIEKVHCINVHPKLREIIFMFQSAKFMIHDNFESLHRSLPTYALPKDYGGSGESLKAAVVNWRRYVMQSRQWITTEDFKRKDEFKRRKARDEYRVYYILKQQEKFDRETKVLQEKLQEKWKQRMTEVSQPEIVVKEDKKDKKKKK